MKKYEVIKYFTDLQDGNHPYEVGDTYPRDGLEPSLERVAELLGTDNKQGVPLIKAVAERKKSAEKTVAEATEEKPKTTRKRKTPAKGE